MKKIFYVLITLILSTLLIPIVFAANEVTIKSIELIEQSDNTVELSKRTTKGLDISFDLSFVEIEDYAKYKVIIDNQEVDIIKVDDTYIGFKLPKGNHNIEIRYTIPYYKEGKIISLIGLGLLILVLIYNKKRNQIN